jgi:hypothetical protein
VDEELKRRRRKVMNKKNLTILGLLLVPMIIFATGCSDDDEANPMGSTSEPSNVMVVHASPDAPAVDLLLDNQIVNSTPLGFPQSTGYLEVTPGTRNVKVNASGTSTTVINADLTLNDGANYTVFAINTLANIEPLVLVDDLTAPAAGNAHVRFVHLSPDAPAVDITLSDGSVVFGNQSFRDATAFTPLPAGTYPLQVRPAGLSAVVLDLGNVTFENGVIYTVFAKGFLSGTGNQALGAEIIVNN